MDAAFSINARVFSAHLNCVTKAYLCSVGETPPACFFSSTEARIATFDSQSRMPTGETRP
jgi:hypothetical protein